MIKSVCNCHIPYCKKCGVEVSKHDDKLCTEEYPALILDGFSYLFIHAKMWQINLREANEKNADHGRHGAMEGDIMLDITSLIQKHMAENIKEQSLINFIATGLDNWCYSFTEILTALNKTKLRELIK